MKITIIAMEIPFPPIHGGRVDIWRRVVALSQLGAEIQLVCWCPEPPSDSDLVVIQSHVKAFFPIAYKRGLKSKIKRVINLLKYPLQVTSRLLNAQEWEALLHQTKRFEPDVIMADHIHSGFLARQMSETLQVPFVVRSHDVEHLHYGYWLQAAKGLNKLKLRLATLHLKDYEWETLEKCAAFYDISVDDLKFWQEQGFQNGRFLAPIADVAISGSPDEATDEPPAPEYDVVFLGNLRTENNVAGVLWFLQSVLPQLRQQRPEISVLISGSNPVPSVIEACEAAQVDVLPNPASASRIYRSGKVLINPISTGSGTSIKSVDMLYFGKPIVTLEKGLFGLPQDARKYFKVATDAESFGRLVLEGLESGETSAEIQAEINAYFGYPVIQAFLDDLSRVVHAQAQTQLQAPASAVSP